MLLHFVLINDPLRESMVDVCMRMHEKEEEEALISLSFHAACVVSSGCSLLPAVSTLQF